MKNANEANEEASWDQRFPGIFASLALLGIITSACAGTPTTHHTMGRELAARPPAWMAEPTISAARENLDEGPEEGEERRNRIGLFLGVTHRASEDDGSFGLEYERRLSDLFGIGLIWESTPSARERVLAVPALFLHPVGDLGVVLAPGVEHEEGEDLFLFRVGLSWDFELGGRFTVAPGVNYDFVEGPNDAFVYGVVVSYGF